MVLPARHIIKQSESVWLAAAHEQPINYVMISREWVVKANVSTMQKLRVRRKFIKVGRERQIGMLTERR